jgi:3-isopropylmalate/(R)-2-methylmalate dehydratase small subunit
MQPFRTLTAVAAPLPLADVDTDKIIPARFMKTVLRTGLGKHLFDPLRYDASGAENPEFVLNKAPYRDAEILIALDNFGCGSSREHAPWALVDFGIRCIIAPSFADIFAANCANNGILTVALPRDICEALLGAVSSHNTSRLTVDLETSQVTTASGQTIAFTVDADRRHRLLNGMDSISRTLENASEIDRFEAAPRRFSPPPIVV